MMDGLVRKSGGLGGGLQKKNDPDCCCDVVVCVQWGNVQGKRNMWGSHNQKRAGVEIPPDFFLKY